MGSSVSCCSSTDLVHPCQQKPSSNNNVVGYGPATDSHRKPALKGSTSSWNPSQRAAERHRSYGRMIITSDNKQSSELINSSQCKTGNTTPKNIERKGSGKVNRSDGEKGRDRNGPGCPPDTTCVVLEELDKELNAAMEPREMPRARRGKSKEKDNHMPRKQIAGEGVKEKHKSARASRRDDRTGHAPRKDSSPGKDGTPRESRVPITGQIPRKDHSHRTGKKTAAGSTPSSAEVGHAVEGGEERHKSARSSRRHDRTGHKSCNDRSPGKDGTPCENCDPIDGQTPRKDHSHRTSQQPATVGIPRSAVGCAGEGGEERHKSARASRRHDCTGHAPRKNRSPGKDRTPRENRTVVEGLTPREDHTPDTNHILSIENVPHDIQKNEASRVVQPARRGPQGHPKVTRLNLAALHCDSQKLMGREPCSGRLMGSEGNRLLASLPEANLGATSERDKEHLTGRSSARAHHMLLKVHSNSGAREIDFDSRSSRTRGSEYRPGESRESKLHQGMRELQERLQDHGLGGTGGTRGGRGAISEHDGYPMDDNNQGGTLHSTTGARSGDLTARSINFRIASAKLPAEGERIDETMEVSEIPRSSETRARSTMRQRYDPIDLLCTGSEKRQSDSLDLIRSLGLENMSDLEEFQRLQESLSLSKKPKSMSKSSHKDCKSKRRVSAASSKLDHDTNFEFAELLATMGNHFSRQPSNNTFEPEARMSAMSQKRFDHSMILEETTQDHVLAGNVDIGGIHQQSSANQKLSRGEMLRFLKNNLKGNV
eukprot:CAMPEP_0114239392 /NCGR_PEP_ID=MMETSP0058-20121206/8436_1 /TAXON_ID=36894 /ORGANISM="Pyramimonas parkeae, CCMP726" /LENGTH=770 /DNA_ID=CAMNT_0001351571 /DNA_START=70 /DNA_END=2382 /DNA_ORIENTATION=-